MGGGVGVLLRTKEPASVQGRKPRLIWESQFSWGEVGGVLLRDKEPASVQGSNAEAHLGVPVLMGEVGEGGVSF